MGGYPQQGYGQGGYPPGPQQWPQQGPANPFDEAALPAWLTQAAGQSYAQPPTGAYGTGTYGATRTPRISIPPALTMGSRDMALGHTRQGPQAGIHRRRIPVWVDKTPRRDMTTRGCPRG